MISEKKISLPLFYALLVPQIVALALFLNLGLFLINEAQRRLRLFDASLNVILIITPLVISFLYYIILYTISKHKKYNLMGYSLVMLVLSYSFSLILGLYFFMMQNATLFIASLTPLILSSIYLKNIINNSNRLKLLIYAFTYITVAFIWQQLALNQATIIYAPPLRVAILVVSYTALYLLPAIFIVLLENNYHLPFCNKLINYYQFYHQSTIKAKNYIITLLLLHLVFISQMPFSLASIVIISFITHLSCFNVAIKKNRASIMLFPLIALAILLVFSSIVINQQFLIYHIDLIFFIATLVLVTVTIVKIFSAAVILPAIFLGLLLVAIEFLIYGYGVIFSENSIINIASYLLAALLPLVLGKVFMMIGDKKTSS